MTQPSGRPAEPTVGTTVPIVDMCGIFFDAAGWESYLRTFADRSPGYLRTFASTLTHHAEADAACYQRALAIDPHRAVDVLLEAGGFDVCVDDHVASLRRQGVRRQVLHGIGGADANGESANERLAGLAARYPDVLEAWVGLDLSEPEQALLELKRSVTDLGMRGASLVHWWGGIDPRDAACHEIYALAAELGVPVWIHAGMNFATNQPLATTCTWQDIDRIAVAHPDLVLIAGHGGWPWILEAVAVLQRHPNVYLDVSAHRPRYFKETGSGWEPLLFYGRTILRQKVLFGSVTWVHHLSIRELADEVIALPIGAPAAQAWLHDNAARLLQLA